MLSSASEVAQLTKDEVAELPLGGDALALCFVFLLVQSCGLSHRSASLFAQGIFLSILFQSTIPCFFCLESFQGEHPWFLLGQRIRNWRQRRQLGHIKLVQI
jgi:hypothetical protein